MVLHKKFHKSIITLPLKEAVDRINAGTNYTALFLHHSIIFVYKESFRGAFSQNEGIIIVGNPNEYGKYPIAHLSGHIFDGATKEPLIGAVLYDNKLKIGATTNRNGAFSMDLPAGEHDLKLSYVGYEDSYRKIKLVSNGSIDFDLFEKTIHLNDVIISSREAIHNVTRTQMSMIHMDSKSLQELPRSLGESDILKSVSYLPGIQTVGEFGSGFNVRGGSSAQNLILLEGVPVFNLSHVFGLISAINSDGIKSFTLWKAGIPARYGGRVSSVMDIQMGPAYPEKLQVTGGIGLINSRLNLNIPVKVNRSFLLLGARSSYSEWLLRKMPDEDLMNSSAGFYDFNAQFGITVNPKNKISLFTYHSSDRFAYGKNTLYTYGNTLISVKWKHIFGNNFSSEALAGYSNYYYDIIASDTLKPAAAYMIQSRLNDYTLKWNASWLPGDHHSIDAGINASLFNINPGKLSPYGPASSINPIDIKPDNALEWTVYASDNMKISSKLNAEIGIRVSNFSLMGPGKVYMYQQGVPKSPYTITDTLFYNHGETVKKYTGIAPRIALRYILSTSSSVKISYNRIFQYVNLISNTMVMTPTDVWKLSDTYFKPLTADQFALGYYKNFRNNTIVTSVEAYFKKLKNVPEYKNGATILLNKYLESDLIDVEGKNYGVELYIKKHTGRLTGWVSYTWSRSFLQSRGEWPSEQINHNSDLDGVYRINVTGITTKGIPVYAETRIRIKPNH